MVAPEVPAAVQAYLNAATRHLPRRARVQIAAELHANLHQRMLDHHLTVDRDAAWHAALRDFGPPQGLARSLGWVHCWPSVAVPRLTLIRAALAALVLGTAGYAAARSLGWPPASADAPQIEQAR